MIIILKSIIYKNFKYKIKSFSLTKVTLEPICLEEICTSIKIENPESKRPRIEKKLKVRENPSFVIKKNKKGSYIVVDSKRYYLMEYFDEWLKNIKENLS